MICGRATCSDSRVLRKLLMLLPTFSSRCAWVGSWLRALTHVMRIGNGWSWLLLLLLLLLLRWQFLVCLHLRCSRSGLR